MTVSYHNRRQRPDAPYRFHASPTELAADSDFLVVACPGGEETRHLVGTEVLEALGPMGVVVNISRGSVIDEKALIKALKAGAIAGAGLDVFEQAPNVQDALMSLAHAVLMPPRGGGKLGSTSCWDTVRPQVSIP